MDFFPHYARWRTAQGNDFLALGADAEELLMRAFREGYARGAEDLRRAAARVAWDMQTKEFGGGTAIGNAIEGIK